MAHLNAAPANTTASVFRCASCRDHYESEDAGPGLCPICNPAEQARDQMLRLLIAEQNDAFRQVLGFAALWRGQHLKGRTVATPGFLAIPERTQAALMNAVITFTDWTEDNDPYEDHSFGRVEAHGVAIFWKIDLYDTAYRYGAETPSDPEQTRRVLTLYLPSEH